VCLLKNSQIKKIYLNSNTIATIGKWFHSIANWDFSEKTPITYKINNNRKKGWRVHDLFYIFTVI